MKLDRPALLIVDMQQGSFTPRSARLDADGVIARLNTLAQQTRAKNGIVIFIQHDGPLSDVHHPSAPGWQLLPELMVDPRDKIVRKTSCDSFLHTDLESVLKDAGARELIVTGCATDFCVDTTVRSALGRGLKTIVPSDGHTTADRAHLKAPQIIAHHNAIWSDFISPAGAAIVRPSAHIFA